MNFRAAVSRLVPILTVAVFAFLSPAFADPTPLPTPSKLETQDLLKQASLKGILHSIERVEAELKERQEEMRSPAGQGRQEEITQQIQALAAKLEQLRRNFIEIASGIDPDIFASKAEVSDIDWSKDLRDILSPLINEVRRLTRRPREMDRLRTSVEEEEALLGMIEQAKLSLERQLQDAGNDAVLAAQLKSIKEEFESRKLAISTQLGIARQKLERRLAEQTSIGESVQNIFQLFFKSRGLNLVLALFSAMIFWLLARRFHLVTGRFFRGARERKGFYQRLISVLLSLATAFGALVVFLVTLYFVGDWVLLILALMLILGIVWTSKQAVHQFWNHFTLLLNMGSCREGERIIYNGLPWQLRSLSLYSNLVNPALVGGNILLPIRDLSTLRSRPAQPDEGWFPTMVGDWVMFDDGAVARVELQTTEFVRVRFNGGAELHIPTAKFLEHPPKNLANGFRHRCTFGLDYSHQKEVLDAIPGALREVLLLSLEAEGVRDELVNLEIELEEAASSALNLSIEADFKGSVGGKYQAIHRAIAAGCVAACNKHGWIIPFNQLTVHLPERIASNER